MPSLDGGAQERTELMISEEKGSNCALCQSAEASRMGAQKTPCKASCVFTNVKVNYEGRKCHHEAEAFSVAALCHPLQEPANTEEAL